MGREELEKMNYKEEGGQTVVSYSLQMHTDRALQTTAIGNQNCLLILHLGYMMGDKIFIKDKNNIKQFQGTKYFIVEILVTPCSSQNLTTNPFRYVQQ